ncbi:MAG: hypothetical protein GX282_03785 [Campylobacteraceae bacterium]|nr:hypothetical protein [Campylobacteraceae bacterium]
MRKVILAILTILAISIIGCSTKNSSLRKSEHALYFIGTHRLALELKTKDNFNTAILSDGDGNSYNLTLVPKSGLYMKNDDGVSIHVKGGMATVKFKNKPPVEVVTLLM